jgi:hypothetical protein
MAQKMGVEFVLLAIFVLFGLANYKRNYFLVTSAIAVVAYMISHSVDVVVGIFIGSFVLYQFNTIMKPAASVEPIGYSEGFQAKDPISIHQRIEEAQVPVVKPSMITGVLESPEILDNLQVASVGSEEVGSARRVQPAGAKGMPEPIPTPRDSADQLPVSGSYETQVPKANPPLQNGPDNQGILTALIAKGTALFSGESPAGK